MTTLRFTPVALSLGLFLAITFTLCVIWGVIFPGFTTMQRGLEAALPWFTWLSWGSFLLGLAESFLYGVYAAAVFVPLYNSINRWSSHTPAKA
jgi:hypothetical protein